MMGRLTPATWVGKKVIVEGETRLSKMPTYVIKQLIAGADDNQYYGFLEATGTFVPIGKIVGVC